MKKVFCIGEALIDFICKDVDVPLSQGQHFVKKAGGAPANVAASIVKLGGRASFCGKVGQDAFGRFLVHEMKSHGIDCTHVITDKNHATTLAFVSLQADGERDFEFVRGADAALKKSEIPESIYEEYDMFHFGSATGLLDGDFMLAYTGLLKEAKRLGKFVSFDPNFRDLLWNDQVKSFVDRVKACLPFVDLIKMSEEEAQCLFNTADKKEIAKQVHAYGIKCMTITCGSAGTYVSVHGGLEDLVASVLVESIDSTGAGDAFIGGLLYSLSENSLWDRSNHLLVWKDSSKVRRLIEFANKVGAMTCTKLGAMESTPTLEEVNGF